MKKILPLIFLLSISLCSAQTKYKFKKELNEAEKKDILKHADSLFYATPNLEFNISTYDIMPYSAIKEEESLKPGYIDGQLKKLQTDPKMAYIYNNNIGNYYQNKGDAVNAETYYNASL
ncbi:MAG: hypothetical protein EOO45_23335, partial [Flavobacterium sp.]